MRADEEYGEHVLPTLYSYFEEVFKRANVRDWFQWSDEERKFTNAARIKEFYSWILGEIDENGELGEAKLPEAKSVRDLGKIIEDAHAFAVFQSQGGTIARALARFEAEHPQEWLPAVTNAEGVLASLSPDVLRQLNEEGVRSLEALRQRVGTVLEDRRRLLNRQDG
jgi:hypothetical protein